MRTWQNSDFDVDRAYGFTVTSVNSRLTGNNTVANGALFKFVECAFNVLGTPLGIVASCQGFNSCVFRCANGSLALLLVGSLVGS